MRIGVQDTGYRDNYMERIQADRMKESESGQKAGRAGEAEKVQGGTDREKGFPVLKDEYIDSENSDRKVSGLYRLGQDEKGNPKVLYEDPEKRAKGEPVKPAEECTGSTDQVDREIEKLKAQKKQLEQQVKAAKGDEKKTKELEKKLAQVEAELNRKDNDAYRKQHMVVS